MLVQSGVRVCSAVSLFDNLKSEVEVTVIFVVIEDALFFGIGTVEEKVRYDVVSVLFVLLIR